MLLHIHVCGGEVKLQVICGIEQQAQALGFVVDGTKVSVTLLECRARFGVHHIQAKREFVTQRSGDTRLNAGLPLSTTGNLDLTFKLTTWLGGDVVHRTGEGIATINCRLWPTYHLDTLQPHHRQKGRSAT